MFAEEREPRAPFRRRGQVRAQKIHHPQSAAYEPRRRLDLDRVFRERSNESRRLRRGEQL
jgi:hypothetical protein